MRYHKRFNNFNQQTIQATKELMLNWGANTQEQNVIKMKKWLEKVAEIYQIQFPMLKIVQLAGAGYYRINKNQICMAYPSIVTLLHEFRHAMQFQNRTRVTGYSDKAEDDARAWSLSLYYKVAPRSFRRLVRQNQIMFVGTEDL